MDDRLNLLELLAELDEQLPQLVIECIGELGPWYKKRNLIKLLSETGDESHIDVISVFLNHDDHRVQRETLTCIYKLSGSNKKKHLLSLLYKTSGSMQPEVVKALIPFADDEVAHELISLLGERRNFSESNANELLKNICKALGQSLSIEAIEPLKIFVQEKGRRVAVHIKDSVYRHAVKAIDQIKSHQQEVNEQSRRVKQLRKDAVKRAARIKTRAVLANKNSSTHDLKEVQEVERLLSQGEKEKAKQLLLDTITKSAKAKQFVRAEKLRQRLIEVDSMALQDIIKTAEIIEEAKNDAISHQQFQVWSKLREILTQEEFNHLYCLMDKISCQSGKTIVKQGEKHPFLYFINKGKVKLFFREKSDDVLIKILASGHIFGAESFFDVSVWTMSAVCFDTTELSVLSLADLNGLQDDFPALEPKLADFCRKYEAIRDFFTIRTRERREYKRYDIVEKTINVMIDDHGNGLNLSGRGELLDLSLGGTTFLYHISNKENSRKMLGSNISISLPLGASDNKTVSVKGLIIAVRGYNIMEHEYTVHVRFNIQLDKRVLQKIIQFGRKHD